MGRPRVWLAHRKRTGAIATLQRSGLAFCATSVEAAGQLRTERLGPIGRGDSRLPFVTGNRNQARPNTFCPCCRGKGNNNENRADRAADRKCATEAVWRYRADRLLPDRRV